MKQIKKEIFYKIMLLGNYDSGKTNFILRYVDNTHNSNTLRTIGMDYRIKRVTLNDGKEAQIQIWDTCSSDRYNHISRLYYNRINGFIIMYNVTMRESFENARNCLREIRDHTNNDNIVLVGNHADVDNNNYYYQREISTKEGQKFAEDNNLLFFETSNITGFNVNECFNALINRIYENDPNKINIELELRQNRPGKRGCLK